MKAQLHDMEELRNRRNVFKNRRRAGEVLSLMLAPEYGGLKNTIVLAIPSGGVPVALEISEGLHCPMDLVIVRKLQIPGNPEAGFGAVTHDGAVFLNEPLLAELRLSTADMEAQKKKVQDELEKRNKRFRGGRPFPNLEGKIAILIDDGLASGYTMTASIHEVKRRKAARTVVAVPTAPLRSIRLIEEKVDDIYCPNVREGPYFSVAGAYEEWCDLDTQEVLRLIRDRAPTTGAALVAFAIPAGSSFGPTI